MIGILTAFRQSKHFLARSSRGKQRVNDSMNNTVTGENWAGKEKQMMKEKAILVCV